MNENTEKLIRELADKLGTTTEHLWGVMVKQATISGSIDLAVGIVLVLLVFYMLPIVKRKTKCPPRTEEERYPSSEWEPELTWVVFVCSTIIIFIIIACCLSNTLSALLNPEYWALKQLLTK